MRILSQLSVDSFNYPNDFNALKVTEAIDHGLISILCSKGFPTYTPLGYNILSKIESFFIKRASDSDFHHVRLPTAMEDNVLESGQNVCNQFRSKLMKLTGNLDDSHVISTPEMLFYQWGKEAEMSYKQFPVRMSYTDNLFRQMPKVKGTLITRQIGIFGGVSFVHKNYNHEQEFTEIRSVIENSLSDIKIPFHIETNYNDFDREYFYISDNQNFPQEGHNLVLPSIDVNERVKAFSLGMTYYYKIDRRIPNEYRMLYRDADNKKYDPQLFTFGMCTNRIMYCMLHHYRDKKGFNLPGTVRPLNGYIIPYAESDKHEAENLYKMIKEKNSSIVDDIAIDERYSRSALKRSISADYVGAPWKAIVNQNKVDVFDRNNVEIAKNLHVIEASSKLLSLNI